MGKNNTLQQRAKEFHGRFGLGKMILFVGQTTTEEELIQISSKRWACIFTSRTDMEIAFPFKDAGQRVQFLDELPGNPLELLRSKDELRIVRVFKESVNRPGKFVPDPKALKAMAELLRDGLNYLIAIGYNYAPDEYDSDIDLIERFLEEYSPKASTIQFWGIRNNEMQQVLESYHIDTYPEELSSTMEFNIAEIQNIAIMPDSEYFFFADGKPITAPVGTALNNQNMMGIVTQRQIELIRPNGKYDCQQWFRNFLERSSGIAPEDGPQWYAYSKRLDFSVKRDCEDALVALVNQLLNNKWPEKKDDVAVANETRKDVIRNVVLEGDPGSGKSVTLAALAYRIFQEHKHPVIFIRDQIRREALNALLEHVKESCGANYPRILVIWDRSAYRPYMQGDLEADLEALVGRYHRFVMVSSAYVTNNYDIKSQYTYSEKTGFLRTDADGVIKQSRSQKSTEGVTTYHIRIDRKLSERECASLWNKFRTCSSIDPNRLQEWKETLNAETDMFQICYKMLNVLRDNYKSSLHREHDVVSSYVQKELSKILNKIGQEKNNTAFASALAEAGFSLEDFGIVDNKQEEHSDTHKLLEQVEIRIAMFSRFDKMEVPYSYVKGLLLSGLSHSEPEYDSTPQPGIVINPDVVYSDDVGEKDLFRLMTSQIPWLRCGENAYGDFVCGFRNSLEAEISLANHNVSAEAQVNILVEMLDYYLSCLESGCGISPLFVTNLGKLLRNMGPNSRHPSFTVGSATVEYAEIQKHIYKVLEPLGEICRFGKSVDKHYVCDYITFIREKYRPEDSAEDRLDWLQKAADFAWEHISAAQDEAASRRILSNSEDRRRKGIRSGTDGILDTLKTEWAQCRRLICQAWVTGNNNTRCNSKNTWTAARFDTEYRTIFQILAPVIDESPTQGLYYNILFQTFLDLQNNFTEDSRQEFLMQLLPYMDSCEVNEPSNDENSRKQLHSRIKQITETRECGQFSIANLNAIENGNECDLSPALCEEYTNSLNNNDPVILVLACRRELANVDFWKTSVTKSLPYIACEANRKVYSLLSRHYKCVCTDPYALWLLLSSTWTEFTGQGIFNQEEPRETYITPQQWQDLYRYSKDYCLLAGAKAKPDACLLYAVSSYYVESFASCKDIIDNWSRPLEDNNHNRRRHPYRLCHRNADDGLGKRITVPAVVCDGKHDGQVMVQIEGRTRYISLNSFGRRNVLPGEAIYVEIGVGYSGFSAYMIPERHE